LGLLEGAPAREDAREREVDEARVLEARLAVERLLVGLDRLQGRAVLVPEEPRVARLEPRVPEEGGEGFRERRAPGRVRRERGDLPRGAVRDADSDVELVERGPGIADADQLARRRDDVRRGLEALPEIRGGRDRLLAGRAGGGTADLERRDARGAARDDGR